MRDIKICGKRRLILWLVTAVVVFAVLPFTFLLEGRSAYYSYKEISYRTIAGHIAGSTEDSEKIANDVMEYVYYSLFTPSEAKIIDKDVYSDFIRGIAWCDQRSWAMCTILTRLGIDNRMLFLKNREGISCHSVAEARIGGKWQMYDVEYGIIVRDSSGAVLSYEEICKNPDAYFLTPKMLMLKKINSPRYENIRQFMATNIYYKDPVRPEAWNNFSRPKDILRKFICGVTYLYIRIFGDWFSNAYQDAYLSFRLDVRKSDYLYLKARNYDIYGRKEKALESYKSFIRQSPADPVVEDALFFMALIYCENGDYAQSIDILESLGKKYPTTKWKPFVLYCLGLNSERLKDYNTARRYYREAMEISDSFDPVERLCSIEGE